MRRDEKLRKMLQYHMQMVEKLKKLDLKKRSDKQLAAFDKTLEELEGYALVHVKTKVSA